ncbi:MAG: sulfurtransferase [Flavobacteriaceae bacterium]
MLQLNQPIVSVKWLYDNLNTENLIVLNGTMNKTENTKQIPNARFFDIKAKFSNANDAFPNAFPATQQFQESARALGINNNSAIVVYDAKGIYSSARVWWLFKAFGYTNVAVLDGGFPEWQQAGYPTENEKPYTGKTGNFVAHLNINYMMFFNNMRHIVNDKLFTVIDARSAKRFSGEEPEPRVGLRSGAIPGSVNLPFTDLLIDGKQLKPKAELQQAFSKLAKPDDTLVFSCGSGITACVLALGAEISGYKKLSVYDGSWTEWGSLVSE